MTVVQLLVGCSSPGGSSASASLDVVQVKDAASSVTPSSNPLKRVTESVKSGRCCSAADRGQLCSAAGHTFALLQLTATACAPDSQLLVCTCPPS
jgi:hypothetical protein